MNKYTISLDATINTSKPTDDVRRIGFRLKRTEMTLENLAEVLTQPYGYTFSPGVFSRDGVRHNYEWVSQQLFALDFDGEITLQEVIERATRYNIIPAFAYSSFSWTETKQKFRLVWVMDELVTDQRVRNLVILALMKIFPEADAHCKDASRIYFGGKDIIFADYDKTISVHHLRDIVVDVIYLTDAPHAGRNLARWSQQVGLHMVNGIPALYKDEVPKMGENTATTNTILVDAVNSPKKDTSPDQTQVAPEKKQIFFTLTKNVNDFVIKYENIRNTEIKFETLRGTDFNQLYDECEVFRDFMNGVDKHHAVTWMIMCNLLLLEGGEKIFWAGLLNRKEYNVSKWEAQMYARRKLRRSPPGYRSVEAWYEGITERMQYANLYLLAESQRGNIQLIKEPDYIPLEKAESFNEMYLTGASKMEDGAGLITCIKAQTGLGKTAQAIKLTLDIPHVIYAAPTHKLKDEIVQRAIEAGHPNVQATPKLPEGSWTAEVKRLYAVGAHTRATALLRNLAKTEPELADYFEKLDNLTDTGLIVTTHAKLPYLETSAPLLIIDEDIYPTLCKQSSCHINDIKALVMTLTAPAKGFRMVAPDNQFAELAKLVEWIDSVEWGVVWALPVVDEFMESARTSLRKAIEDAVVNDPTINSNVLGFFWATHFIKNRDSGTLEYSVRREIPVEKTAIIMSATLNKRMCELLYGDRLVWREVPMAREASPTYLHPGYSYSRTSIKRREAEYKKLIKDCADDGYSIITFKKYADESDAIKATFGATAGLDVLKGEDIAIIGTPYLTATSYMLTAAALGVPLASLPGADKMEYRVIQRNDFTFRCMVFTILPDLEEVQLAMIESELVQAVGRARSLRVSDVRLHLYSTFPVKGAKLAR